MSAIDRLSLRCLLSMFLVSAALFPSGVLRGEITYSFNNPDSWPSDIRWQIETSVAEAVSIYNQFGSFNKHLYINYNPWVPTAEANSDGTISFGTMWGTRVTLHEMTHTLGCGTTWEWGQHMWDGRWHGVVAETRIQELDGPGAVLWGDKWHFWPYGLNYDNEDNPVAREKMVKMVAAMRCDMGFLGYIKEPESQNGVIGGAVEFRVESYASDYRWCKVGTTGFIPDSDKVSGAKTKVLRISGLEASDVGSYYCRAYNNGEWLSSRPAGLAVVAEAGDGYWPLDGNCEDVLGDQDGVAYGRGQYTSGKVGQGIDLDGSADRVILPDGIADAEDITVACWVYWRGGDAWQRVFDFGNNTDEFIALVPGSGDGTLRFVLKNRGGEQRVDAGSLAENQWVHLAVTLSGDRASMFVNGERAAYNNGVTIDPIDFLPSKNYIGDSQFSADPMFNGVIDDFYIYNRGLSELEIADMYWRASGEKVCVEALRPSLKLDFDGNCRVDMEDLAELAAGWLDCGVYPMCFE